MQLSLSHADGSRGSRPDALWVVGTDGVVRFASDASQHFFPPGGMAAPLGAKFPFALRDGEVQDIAYEEKGAMRSAQLRISAFAWEGEPAWLACLRDNTGEQLRQQRERLESLGRFAGGIAHDLNNLLTVIIACATFLSHKSDNAEAVRDDAARILATSDRATALIARLSALSGRKCGKPESRDLGEAISGLQPRLRELLPDGIALDIAPVPEPLPVLLDASQLEEILVSLVDNARDAMPKGGRLMIALVIEGGRVLLRVGDNGCGMSPEELAHAFDPFFTTKTRRRGTGLSLTLAHAMMREAGGDISLVSTVGVGTTVTLSFPRGAMVPAATPAASREEKQKPSGGETILLVEDDEDVLEALVTVLGKSGYKVVTACDGVEGLEVAKRYNGAIHATLSDVSMPRMNGYDLAKALRAHNPAARILLMSGNNDGKGEMVINKPFRPQELVSRVRELLDMPLPAP